MSGAAATNPDGGLLFFFFNDTATTEIYTLSRHDALPISGGYIDIQGTSSFDNLASGSFADQTDTYILNFSGSATPAFINEGSFTKSTSGTTAINITFTNNGAVNVNSGTLTLQGGGSASGS